MPEMNSEQSTGQQLHKLNRLNLRDMSLHAWHQALGLRLGWCFMTATFLG